MVNRSVNCFLVQWSTTLVHLSPGETGRVEPDWSLFLFLLDYVARSLRLENICCDAGRDLPLCIHSCLFLCLFLLFSLSSQPGFLFCSLALCLNRCASLRGQSSEPVSEARTVLSLFLDTNQVHTSSRWPLSLSHRPMKCTFNST